MASHILTMNYGHPYATSHDANDLPVMSESAVDATLMMMDGKASRISSGA